MFQIGDQVIYGIHGVCRVTGMEERSIDRKKVRYLILQPINGNDTRFYVPAENPAALAKLRRIMNRQELEALLRSEEVRQDGWISDENSRKQRYRELIVSGDRLALLKMIRALHIHKREQAKLGRKFHLSDENFLRDAEKLLNAEFSLVLGIDSAKVAEYIRSALDA